MQVNIDMTIKVLIGRILAGIVILLALIAAIIGAATARSGGFLTFLTIFVTPLALGFLIIVATEILGSIEGRRADGDGGGSALN